MSTVVETLQCPVTRLVVIGDRYLTDVVFGNLHGALTIYTEPCSTDGENFAVRLVWCFFLV
jgi:phosphatidylglycerophosphatase GEP4